MKLHSELFCQLDGIKCDDFFCPLWMKNLRTYKSIMMQIHCFDGLTFANVKKIVEEGSQIFKELKIPIYYPGNNSSAFLTVILTLLS